MRWIVILLALSGPAMAGDSAPSPAVAEVGVLPATPATPTPAWLPAPSPIQAQAPDAAPPCSQGAGGISFAGVNVESMKCELQSAFEAVGQQAITLVRADARDRMAAGNLAKAQAETAALTKQLVDATATLTRTSAKLLAAEKKAAELETRCLAPPNAQVLKPALPAPEDPK